jgi:hypothetical protein
MAILLPNRITETFPPEALTATQGAVVIMVAGLGTRTPILEKDFKALPKIGDKTKPYADDLVPIIENSPKYLHAKQTLAKIKFTKARYDQCAEIRKALVPFLDLLEREQAIAGAEYRNHISVYVDKVKYEAKGNDQDAQMVLDEINLAAKKNDYNIHGGKK